MNQDDAIWQAEFLRRIADSLESGTVSVIDAATIAHLEARFVNDVNVFTGLGLRQQATRGNGGAARTFRVRATSREGILGPRVLVSRATPLMQLPSLAS